MPLETLYLLHHSHTDIGFTQDQPILWEMERRFIDMAIDAAERHADHDGDHAFKWVVETMAPKTRRPSRAVEESIRHGLKTRERLRAARDNGMGLMTQEFCPRKSRCLHPRRYRRRRSSAASDSAKHGG